LSVSFQQAYNIDSTRKKPKSETKRVRE
jgi:hypothetical protein